MLDPQSLTSRQTRFMSDRVEDYGKDKLANLEEILAWETR